MKRKELPERERMTTGYLKSFFDRIAPSIIRFYPDSFVCGNSWRCVYPNRGRSGTAADSAQCHP